jgi:histidine triad (HIT) family protein
MQNSSCIFCQIIAGKIPAYRVHEDDLSVAFLSIDPIKPGHTVIIPKKHHNFIWDIQDQDLYNHLFTVARDLALKLKSVYQTKAVIQLIEGFEVPHAHIHLIPSDQPLSTIFKNRSNNGQNQPDFKKLQQEAQKINAELKPNPVEE